MDKEIIIIREFCDFVKKILTKNKSVDNMYRLVSKPKDLTPAQVTEIKQVFSSYFTGINEWSNFKGSIDYKTGSIPMALLEKTCFKNSDDKQIFFEYLESIKAFYFDMRKNLNEFVKNLGLEEGSPEATFVTGVFNDIGGEVIDIIKSGGSTKDIATLLPKAFEMFKSGKLLSTMDKLKDGSVKISIILKAFIKLVEDYENQNTVQIEDAEQIQSVVEED